ncbi:hypothetical protein KP509_20G002700 [Ceratopteris richardii]|nr:hypothetical protein KP509_20G002700 [Ceratopteris richardii]
MHSNCFSPDNCLNNNHNHAIPTSDLQLHSSMRAGNADGISFYRESFTDGLHTEDTVENHETRFSAHDSSGIDEKRPRIRPPPCRSYAQHVRANMNCSDNNSRMQANQLHRKMSSRDNPRINEARSRFKAGFSVTKRRPDKGGPAPQDDPYWLAMVACADDHSESPLGRNSRKGLKALLSGEAEETDSWLARRLQETVHLDHCTPHHSFRKSHAALRRTNSSSGSERAGSHASHSDIEMSSCSSMRRVHDVSSEDHHHNEDDLGAARLAGRGLLPRSTSKSASHRKAPPLVNISCGSRRWQSSRPQSRSTSGSSKRKNIPESSALPLRSRFS